MTDSRSARVSGEGGSVMRSVSEGEEWVEDMVMRRMVGEFEWVLYN